MKIFAISGGGNGAFDRPYELKDFDKHIVELTGSKTPQLLFVSFSQNAITSADSYYDIISKNFKAFGCKCQHLSDRDLVDLNQVKQKIEKANIIYVGGGNTIRLMQKWRKYGIDKMIVQAGRRGAVLCGVSAGAICWCHYGNSDSRRFTSGSDKLIKVTGLGLVDVLFCPHFDVEPHRQTDIVRMMRTTKGVALALDNLVALEVIDNKYKIYKLSNSAQAYKCYWQRGKFVKQPLKPTGTIAQLVEKK